MLFVQFLNIDYVSLCYLVNRQAQQDVRQECKDKFLILSTPLNDPNIKSAEDIHAMVSQKIIIINIQIDQLTQLINYYLVDKHGNA